MKRTLPFFLIALAGCQPILPATLEAPAPTQAKGTLNVHLFWPQRAVQVIPLSTQTIRLRILKNGSIRSELPLSRPADTGKPLVSMASLQVDAGTYSVLAEAFKATPIASSDVPVASNSVDNVSVVANQKTPVQLSLLPVFVPTLTDFNPKNGGPGTSVTLIGSFGTSGYYGLSLGGVRGYGSASGSNIVATIPAGATSNPLVALADGVSSSPGATFKVLAGLSLTPPSATASVSSGAVSFSVPTATDTSSQTVDNPTITRWEVVDPTKLSQPAPPTSTVGTISANGAFTPQATGTAWVRVWSGNLFATASVTVN